MAKVRGIVAKVEGKKCILLTPTGEFVKINRTPHPVKVGQDVELGRGTNPWYRLAAVAAAVVLIGLILPLYPLLTASAQPVAYLSVDINPSLELGVNKDGKVVQVKSFNQAGGELSVAASVTNEGIYQAIQALIRQALKQGFLARGKPNLILAVYTDNAKFQFNNGQIQAAVQQAVASTNIPVELVVTGTSMAMHRQATANRISQGKYLVLNAMKARGKDISVENMQQDGVSQALSSQGLNIADVVSGVTKLDPGSAAGIDGADGGESQPKGTPEMKDNGTPKPDNGNGQEGHDKPSKPEMQKGKDQKSEDTGNSRQGQNPSHQDDQTKMTTQQPVTAQPVTTEPVTTQPTMGGQTDNSGSDHESSDQGNDH